MSNAYTDTDSGNQVKLRVGEEFTVELSESRMGGYKWEVIDGGIPVLKQVGVESQATASLTGNPNRRTWRFIAAEPGSVQLHMQHKRSWEADSAGRQFSLSVNVAA